MDGVWETKGFTARKISIAVKRPQYMLMHYKIVTGASENEVKIRKEKKRGEKVLRFLTFCFQDASMIKSYGAINLDPRPPVFSF